MSGLLKNKKFRFAAISAVILTVAAIVILHKSELYMFIYVFCIAEILAVALMYADYKTYKAFKKQMEPFFRKGKIRNVDYVIIGEPCEPHDFVPLNATYVQITDPGVSEAGAYQILNRVHSILKSNGTVIFVLNRKKTGCNKLGLLDTFFFHDITVSKLKLEKLSKLKKFVLFLKPLSSIRLIFGIRHKNFTEYFDVSSEIKNFCEERNYNFQIFAG